MENDKPAAAGEGEFGIGFGNYVSPQIQAETQTAIDEATARVYLARQQAESALLARIDACLERCKQIGGNCSDCINGKLDNTINSNDDILASVHADVLRHIDSVIKQNDIIASQLPTYSSSGPIHWPDGGLHLPDNPTGGGGGGGGTGPSCPNDKTMTNCRTINGVLVCTGLTGNNQICQEKWPTVGDFAALPCSNAVGSELTPSGNSSTVLGGNFHYANHGFNGKTCVNSAGAVGLDGIIIDPGGVPRQVCSFGRLCDSSVPSGPTGPDTISPGGGNCPPPIINVNACCPTTPPEPPAPPAGDGTVECGTFPASLSNAGFSVDSPPLDTDILPDGSSANEAYTQWQTEAQSCPPPDAPPPPPQQQTFTSFCDPAKVRELANNALDSSFNILGSSPIGSIDSDTGFFSYIFSFITGGISDAIASTTKTVLHEILNSVANTVGNVISSLPTPDNCDSARYHTAVGRAAMADLAGGWFGAVPESTRKALGQQVNYQCQTGILDSMTATELVIQQTLSKDEWEDCLKLNGDCTPWFQRIVDSKQNRFAPQEALAAWRANCIDDDELQRQLKLAGFETDDKWLNALKNITEEVPGTDELFRWMIRHVTNPEAVEEFKLDGVGISNFDKLYTADVEALFKRRGVRKEWVKNDWRAHWVHPSPGQLYEILQRCRPDADVKDADGQQLVADQGMVERDLRIQDYVNKWIPYMIAMSYKPLPMRVMGQMVAAGIFERDDLVGPLQDWGFVKGNAEKMADTLYQVNLPRRAKLTSGVSEEQLQSMFIADGISQDEYEKQLEGFKYKPEKVQALVTTARLKRTAKDMRGSLTKLRSAYMSFRLDDNEYRASLNTVGVEPKRGNEIVSRDSNARKWLDKPIALEKLCKLVGQGYMAPSDYLTRTINMGYKPQDAMMLVNSCMTDVVEKQQAKIQKAMKEAQAVADKIAARERKIQKQHNAVFREQFPCKAKSKPPCPTGVTPPVPAMDEVV